MGALWLAGCGALGDAEPQRDWPEPSPALWEVTGPEGQRAWLFGTIHALPDNVEWRTPALEAVIDTADLLMVEIDDLGATRKAGAAFEQRAYSEGLPPLTKRVRGSDRAALISLLNAVGMDESEFERTESWAAALTLGNAIRCSDADNGVDRALLNDFTSAQGMESFEMQFDMFDRLSSEAQTDLLLSIAQSDGCRGNLDRVEAWVSGDVEQMMAGLEAGFRDNAELRNALLVRRNEWFAERLVRYHRLFPNREVLLAVGGGHMPGSDGVLARLERAGYSVRRIQ